MLPPGHAGPHVWKRDDVISREFADQRRRELIDSKPRDFRRSEFVPGVKGRSYIWEDPPYEGLSVEDVDILISMIDGAFRAQMERLRARKGTPQQLFKHVLKQRDFSFGRIAQQVLERKRGRPKGAVSKLTPADKKLLADYDASGKTVAEFTPSGHKRSKLRRLLDKRDRGQLVD
jgi:hypothetical protein